jgi:hypothetical protein
LAGASTAGASTSVSVGYVFDFGTGSNDEGGPGTGSSIWVNALTGRPANGTYTTADSSKTVTVTDMPVSKIDELGAAALAPFDTLIVYQVCDIGSHPATVTAINSFLEKGGKVLLTDADACAPGPEAKGLADYSKFRFPFTTNSPGPRGLSGFYTALVPSTLTAGLALGEQESDTVGDANIFTSFSGEWCASITGTNALGANGFVEAFARTAPAGGGLVIYEGEDFWFTKERPEQHLRLVFDNELKQNWAPDGLPCRSTSNITLSPASQSKPAGSTATVTATVTNENGEAQQNVKVSIKVNEGPNKGQEGSGTTNASGQLALTYPDTGGTGTDKLTAIFVDGEGKTHTSNTAEVIWERSAVQPHVYVGYADQAASDHGSPSGHPKPWKGEAGVAFVGCGYGGKDLCPRDNGADVYDAGAIRLDAPAGSALTITGASVTVGPCRYNPWPGLNKTVRAGGKLILTQTGKHQCTTDKREQDNFDTSESFLKSPQYTTFQKTKKCSNDGYIAEITLTINGQSVTLNDRGQVLNTGGSDTDICEKKSEFRAWTLIQ